MRIEDLVVEHLAENGISARVLTISSNPDDDSDGTFISIMEKIDDYTQIDNYKDCLSLDMLIPGRIILWHPIAHELLAIDTADPKTFVKLVKAIKECII